MVHGLKRAWAIQAAIDTARDHVESVVLSGDAVFLQSQHGVIHCVDAETGRTRWSEHVGNRNHPTLAPAANKEFVVVLNGNTFYLLRADSGRLIWERELAFAPSAAPSVNDDRAFIVLLNGMLVSYQLPTAAAVAKEEDQAEKGAVPDPVDQREPWSARSSGTPLSRPVVTRNSVTWTTERGLVYMVDLATQEVRFEFRTRDEIASSPAVRWPLVYVTSRDQHVYAFHERTGREVWRFSASSPLLEPPVVLGDMLCAVTQAGGMHCLDSETGRHLWWAPQATRFVAASPGRIYVADPYSRIHIIDRQSGVRLDSMATERLPLHVFNVQNDRLYLGTTRGLLQCLHEEGLTTPATHEQVLEPLDQDEPGNEGAGIDEPAATEPDAEQPTAEPGAGDAFDDPAADADDALEEPTADDETSDTP